MKYIHRKYAVPDNKVHGASMGPTWVLSAPGEPHVGPVNLAIRGVSHLGSYSGYVLLLREWARRVSLVRCNAMAWSPGCTDNPRWSSGLGSCGGTGEVGSLPKSSVREGP